MKKPRLIVLPEFREDIRSEYKWYEKRSPGLGAAFARAATAAADFVTRFPESCPVVKEGVRRKWLKRFNHSVVYAANEQLIVLIGVTHGSQNLKRWLRLRTGMAEEE